MVVSRRRRRRNSRRPCMRLQANVVPHNDRGLWDAPHLGQRDVLGRQRQQSSPSLPWSECEGAVSSKKESKTTNGGTETTAPTNGASLVQSIPYETIRRDRIEASSLGTRACIRFHRALRRLVQSAPYEIVRVDITESRRRASSQFLNRNSRTIGNSVRSTSTHPNTAEVESS